MTSARPRCGPVSRLAVAACCLVAAPGGALAEAASTRWQWDATVYLWFPSFDGETHFPPSDGGPALDISGDQVIDSIEFVFMAAVDARRGRWGVSTDVVYLDLGASKDATREFGIGHIELPADVNADLALDISGWLWTLDGTYTVVDQPVVSMQALAGARVLDLQEHLDWTLGGNVAALPFTERSGSSRAQDTVWDGIVGVRGRTTFPANPHWYVPYYADVGTGESRFTWQAMVGLGYRFESVSVMGVWRHLDYDLGDNAPIRALEFDGPAVGVQIRF